MTKNFKQKKKCTDFAWSKLVKGIEDTKIPWIFVLIFWKEVSMMKREEFLNFSTLHIFITVVRNEMLTLTKFDDVFPGEFFPFHKNWIYFVAWISLKQNGMKVSYSCSGIHIYVHFYGRLSEYKKHYYRSLEIVKLASISSAEGLYAIRIEFSIINNMTTVARIITQIVFEFNFITSIINFWQIIEISNPIMSKSNSYEFWIHSNRKLGISEQNVDFLFFESGMQRMESAKLLTCDLTLVFFFKFRVST